jgi:hypothetical protein
VVAIILTLYHPIYGILLYFFEWHNHPPYWWWGDKLPDLRWSFLIAVLILVSVIINRKKLKPFTAFEFKPLIWLVLIVVNSYIVSYLFAMDPLQSFSKSEILFKLTVNYLLMIYVIRDLRDYKALIFMLLLCVANFGRVAWEEGSNRDLGVMAPGATTGNLIAAYIMTIIPFYITSFILGNKWMKIFTILSLPFVLNALILENSRGTILGLASMGALAPFLVKGKMRFKVIIGLAFGALMFLQLSNEQFWERQSTTVEYEKEHSAMSRIYLWKGALNFLSDYPYGGGGDGWIIHSAEYVPEMREYILQEEGTTVHNTFLNVATDWGYIGLFFYLGFLASTYIIMIRVKRDSKHLPNGQFYNIQIVGLILALSGGLVAGFFSNRQYAENFFWFSTFAVVLRNMQKNELKEYEEAQKSIDHPKVQSGVEIDPLLTPNPEIES